MTGKLITSLLLTILLCNANSGSSLESGLTIYCWQGATAFSNLGDPKFAPKWKSVLNEASNRIIIEIYPNRGRLLEMMRTASILYGSTHSGIPKKATEQALQIGKDDSADRLLMASELVKENIKRPRLIIINGFSTFPLLPENAGECLNIASAFGINKETRGRTYLGFEKAHPGPKGDDFFRVFFYFWAGSGGKDMTIKQAIDKSKEYIDKMVRLMGGDNAEKNFLSTGAANIYNDLRILGDPNLMYKDLGR